MSESIEQVKELTAANLKNALWETLNDLRAGRIKPREADSIASQAREITRIVKLQLQVVGQTKAPVPLAVIGFTGT